MSVNNNHYINKLGILLIGLLMLIGQTSNAQHQYDKVQNISLWHYGENINGIRLIYQDAINNSFGPNRNRQNQYNLPEIDNLQNYRCSYAELLGTMSKGDFHSPNGTKSEWSAGGEAKTILSLPKFSMQGSFGFTQTEGKDMCGSMFIKPLYYPVDIMEFTPGNKRLQEYFFSGGISKEIAENWLLGGNMEFNSSNYSKTKDIRHTNYRLNLKISPSVLYSINNLNLGLSYIFRKTSEYVKADQIGTATADSYYAFLNKGLMFGEYGVWDGSVLHLNEKGVNRFPVKEFTNGLAFQANYKNLYADVAYYHNSGEIGEKDYLWYKFPSDEIRSNLAYKIQGKSSINVFHIEYQWKNQVNREYVLEKINEGGITIPVIYDYNQIYQRKITQIKGEYFFYGKVYEANVEFNYKKNSGLSSLIFPTTNSMDIDIYSIDLKGKRKIKRLDVGMALSFNCGNYSNISEEVLDYNVHTDSKAFFLKDWFLKQKEWEESSKIGLNLNLRYNYSKFKGLYTRIDLNALKGFKIDLLDGDYFYGGNLSVGIEF